MSRALVIGLGAMTACGRIDFDPVDVPTSGSRLKLTYTEAPGGARSDYGAYDTLLGRRCFVRTTEDGTTRCIPSGQPTVYRDAACTQPVAYNALATTPKCTTEPLAVVSETLSNGRTRTQVYELGASTTVAVPYTIGAGGVCAVASALPVDTQYFDVGSEIPLDMLVTLTRANAGAGRLQQRFYTSADGFRMPADLYDTELDTACIPGQTALGASCVPTEDVTNTVYATDATCSDRVAASFDDAVPRFALDRGDSVCGEYPSPSYLGVGAEIAMPSELHDPSSSSCPTRSLPPNATFHATTGAVSLASLSEVPLTSGGSRIQLMRRESAEGATTDVSFYDTLLDHWCVSIDDGTGTLRCTPLPIEVKTFFTDPACTNPIDLAQVVTPTGCVPKTYRFGYRNSAFTQCPGSVDIFELGAFRTGPVYTLVGTICADFSPNATFAYYTIARQLARDELAPLAEVIEK